MGLASFVNYFTFPYYVETIKVSLGVMAMKGYSTVSKVPALLEPHHPGYLLDGGGN